MRFLATHLICAVLLLATCAYGDHQFVSHYDNGQVKLIGKMNDKGQRVGEWIEYYETGQVMDKVHHKDGKRHGERIYYYENGQVELKMQYKDGKLHGEQMEYNEQGKVINRRVFEDGKIISEEEFEE